MCGNDSLASKKYTIEEAKKEYDADNINFLTQQETSTNETQFIKSSVWNDYRRMLIRSEQHLIENLVWCFHCKTFVAYYGSTTSFLLTHSRKCPNRPLGENETNSESKIAFKLDDLKQMREAAAKFVIRDLRPYAAIEGEGLLDLMYSAVELGRKYPRMTKSDLKRARPTRNTLKPYVHGIADEGKKLISRKIRHAIDTTGT